MYRSELQRCRGQFTEAMESIDIAITAYDVNPGPESLDAAEAYFEKASVLEAMGDITAAQELFQMCYAIRMGKLGAEHQDTVEVQLKLTE